LLPALTYVPEHQPQPSGRLPHNPLRDTHETDGGTYLDLDRARFPDSLCPPSSEESLDWRQGLVDLQRAASERSVPLIPWLSLLTGRVASPGNPELVVNAEGEPVVGWLCPARPRTRAYAVTLLAQVIELWQPRAVFIDRFRYPEWSANGIADALSCRCSVCRQGAGGIRGRVEAVDGLVRELAKVCRARGVALWLDVWPPSYARVLGQDLELLAHYASWCKPFAYHRLGGGADLAGIIRALSPNEDERQRLWRALLAYFEFEGPEMFSTFERQGFPTSWATEEFHRAARMLGTRCLLAAGVQLWQVGPEGAREAITAALAARPRGVIGYCYGWASEGELAAAGDELLPLLSKPPAPVRATRIGWQRRDQARRQPSQQSRVPPTHRRVPAQRSRGGRHAVQVLLPKFATRAALHSKAGGRCPRLRKVSQSRQHRHGLLEISSRR
jgi:hypothetical protein